MQVKLKLPQLQAQASLASTPMSPGAPGARSLTMLDMGEISIPLDILTNLTGIIDLLWLAHLSVALAPNKVEFDHHQLLGLQYEALTPTFRVLDQMSAGACSPYFRSKFQAPFWPTVFETTVLLRCANSLNNVVLDGALAMCGTWKSMCLVASKQLSDIFSANPT